MLLPAMQRGGVDVGRDGDVGVAEVLADDDDVLAGPQRDGGVEVAEAAQRHAVVPDVAAVGVDGGAEPVRTHPLAALVGKDTPPVVVGLAHRPPQPALPVAVDGQDLEVDAAPESPLGPKSCARPVSC